MLLHTLNDANNLTALKDCLRTAAKGDAVLLLDDGVYLAAAGHPDCKHFIENDIEVFALQHDCAARGVVVDSAVIEVDMDGFVALTERFTKQLAWC